MIQIPPLMMMTHLLMSFQTPRLIPLSCFPPAIHIVKVTNLSYSPQQMNVNKLIFQRGMILPAEAICGEYHAGSQQMQDKASTLHSKPTRIGSCLIT